MHAFARQGGRPGRRQRRALLAALRKLGVEVDVLFPGYPSVLDQLPDATEQERLQRARPWTAGHCAAAPPDPGLPGAIPT